MFVPPAARITVESEESRVLCLQKEIRILILFPGNDGGRSSMVEPQIVVLVVAGSSPVGHPGARVPLAFRAILGFDSAGKTAPEPPACAKPNEPR